jgi:tRNA modification GTPase
MSDAICAVATGNGHSAIGIIRISGDSSHNILEKIFKPVRKKPLISKEISHRAFYGYIVDGEKNIDDALVLFFSEGKSFTGEESAEIYSHGNPLILRKILSALYKHGCRPANPGEFTYRAFLSGRIDLTEAEAIKEIIEARTERHLQKAVLKKEGFLKNKLYQLRSALINITADITAELDFSDEGLEFVSSREKSEILRSIIEEINEWVENSQRFNSFKNGLEFVLVGAPNAGKSSLLNILSGRNRAIVSDIPGTTRDYIEASLEINGVPVVFVDTAGIRGKDFDNIEKMGMEKTLEKFQEADLRLIIIDSSVEPDIQDLSGLADYLHFSHTHKAILVLNKWDVVHSKWNDVLNKVEFWGSLFKDKEINTELYFPELKQNIFCVSAITGMGISNLQKRFEEVVELSLPHNDSVVLSVWQVEIMEKVVALLKESISMIENKVSEEITVENLNHSLRYIGELTGEISSEELLGRIFSRFCIGK